MHLNARTDRIAANLKRYIEDRCDREDTLLAADIYSDPGCPDCEGAGFFGNGDRCVLCESVQPGW